MKILITGGSGFIGTYLVGDLLKQGHQVSIYDTQECKKYPGLCTLGDIRDGEKLSQAMKGSDAVYHLAAEHRDDVRPVSLYYDVNVGGAEKVVLALEENGVEQLIFTSTVALYGLNAQEPDEDSQIKPFNDYGWSKYKAEHVFGNWCKALNKRCLVVVRPTVIFGEGNRGNVYNLLRQIASNRFIMVGSGQNKKSMGYILNFSSFMRALLKSPPGKHVYNYADKPDLTMAELVRIARDALGEGRNNGFGVPYSLGLLAGYAFDCVSKVSGKNYPVSSIRIKKFCADTRISSQKLREVPFTAPYSLKDGLNRMIRNEFA